MYKSLLQNRITSVFTNGCDITQVQKQVEHDWHFLQAASTRTQNPPRPKMITLTHLFRNRCNVRSCLTYFVTQQRSVCMICKEESDSLCLELFAFLVILHFEGDDRQCAATPELFLWLRWEKGFTTYLIESPSFQDEERHFFGSAGSFSGELFFICRKIFSSIMFYCV